MLPNADAMRRGRHVVFHLNVAGLQAKIVLQGSLEASLAESERQTIKLALHVSFRSFPPGDHCPGVRSRAVRGRPTTGTLNGTALLRYVGLRTVYLRYINVVCTP